MKISKDVVSSIAEELTMTYNPYIENSKRYKMPDGNEYYLFHDDVFYTENQLDNMYKETAEHDIIKGFEDRMVGYYDKWYRYNHADEGRAYDEGVKYATTFDECIESMRIIPAW